MGRQSVSTVAGSSQWVGVALALAAALGAFLVGSSSAPAAATPPSRVVIGQAPDDGEQLAVGAAVFSRACTSCHQVGGVGLPGQFPPLKGNPNITGADYVEQTVRAGKQGPITVKGVEYDGVMPVVGNALTDEEITAVAAYIAADLTLPEGVVVTVPEVPSMPGPPTASVALIVAGFLLAGAVGAVVVGPLVLGRNDQLELSWVDAGLKSAIIVGYFVVAAVIVPGRFMELDQITSLDRDAQYLLGAGVWGGGFLIGLVALWWTGRKGLL